MIIMTLAYAQRANVSLSLRFSGCMQVIWLTCCKDNAFLTAHYDLLRQWNEYLIEEALIPADQISTDDFAGSLA